MMKPILFNTEMVRAILDGRKTVTRRVVKPQPQLVFTDGGMDYSMTAKPKYAVGEILWVRETFKLVCDNSLLPHKYFYIYRASDDGKDWETNAPDWTWCPSIHMPKEAARIFLKVTDVRVERLHDITTEEIEKEGLYCDLPYTKDHFAYSPGMLLHWQKLWNSTIKKAKIKKCGWNANPWVFVYEFEICEKPDRFGVMK